MTREEFWAICDEGDYRIAYLKYQDGNTYVVSGIIKRSMSYLSSYRGAEEPSSFDMVDARCVPDPAGRTHFTIGYNYVVDVV